MHTILDESDDSELLVHVQARSGAVQEWWFILENMVRKISGKLIFSSKELDSIVCLLPRLKHQKGAKTQKRVRG